MCGRFTIFTKKDKLENRFNAKFLPKYKFNPRYNAAPSQPLPVILNTIPDKIVNGEWGMIPFWAKDKDKKPRWINTRKDSLSTKVSFKNTFKNNRCLVLADGFYEWKRTKGKKTKTPYYFHLKNNIPFAFAGLYEMHQLGKYAIPTFSIITVKPNTLAAKVHDRMPAILKEEDEAAWIGNDFDQKKMLKLLRAYPAAKMKAYQISDKVNIPSNDAPDVIEKI